jgi:hypothetical protein
VMRQIGLVPAGNHANLTGAISNGKLVAYASNLSVSVPLIARKGRGKGGAIRAAGRRTKQG